MKKLLFYMMLCSFLTYSCAHGSFPLGRPHGDPAPYGEGRHPGIDFDIFTGKPIIACSDGDLGDVVKAPG